MTIKTKYNVGDKVYTIDKNSMKVLPFKIKSIVSVSDESTAVRLTPEGSDYESYDEKRCFPSEDELIRYITDYGDHKEMF